MVGQDFRIGYCEITISLMKSRCFQLKFPFFAIELTVFASEIARFVPARPHRRVPLSAPHRMPCQLPAWPPRAWCHKRHLRRTPAARRRALRDLGTFMGWWAFDPSKSIKTRSLTKGHDPQWGVGWLWTKHNMEFWPTQMRFWPTNMGKQYSQPNTAKDYHRGCMTNVKGT